MGRSAYDFEEHGVKNIRAFVRNFSLPKPDAFIEKDSLFVLGKAHASLATDVNKSHENTLESRHEKWRYLENIIHLSLEVICPLKCEYSSLIIRRLKTKKKSPRDKYQVTQYTDIY